MENKTLDLYREGATLSKFIREGRPTITKRLSLLFDPSDETIRRLYGIPSEENYIDDFEVKIDKRLQFQVNWLNISRDKSIKAWPEIHLKSEVLHSLCNPDPTMIV